MRRFFEIINKNIFSGFQTISRRYVSTKEELPLITISREMGSGGRLIAYLVAKKLKKPWKVFHEDIIDKIAVDARLEKKLIREIDENKIPVIDEIVGEFFGKRYVTLSKYYKHLTKILSEIGNRGYAVIVGRGANYLFPHALKVRMVCEMHQRIEWEMEFEGLTRIQAVNRIKESDEKRYEFEKALYGHDIRKAHHYDLVIRTGPSLSIKDAADVIVFMAKIRFSL